jgi:cell division protein FtsW
MNNTTEKSKRPEKAPSEAAPAQRQGKKPIKSDVKVQSYKKTSDGKEIVAADERSLATPGEKIVRYKGTYDYGFLTLVLILICFGSFMVFSASYVYSMTQDPGNGYLYISRQIMYVGLGLIPMFLLSRLEPEVIKKFTPLAYGITIGLLVLVFFIGTVGGGAKRWLMIGPVSVQPSEVAKAALVLMLARHFDNHSKKVLEPLDKKQEIKYGLLYPLFYTIVICMLVALEKHLSGTIIIFLIGIIVMWCGGANQVIMLASGGIGLTLLGLVAWFVPYTRRRIDIWFHPEADLLGSGWQTMQGLHTIGSGGLFGLGPANSRQKFGFVSQPQNDFIFSILCEELGFIGAMAVIILFIVFIFKGYKIATKAPDVFSSLVVTGIVTKVALQAAFNIGVVTNTLPNTGISLPFFSYGGSSTIVLLAEMGIVLSISRFSGQDR